MSKSKTSQSPAAFNLDGTRFHLPPLSLSFAKSQYLLRLTIGGIFRHFPVSHVLLLTLTFADAVTSTKEAHRRLNSLLNKVRRRHSNYLWILEPQENGRIHYHLLLPVMFDAHDGTCLAAWENKHLYTDEQRRQAMNPGLRAESDWWEKAAPNYGFGRVQVAPIYSNGEAIGKYLTKQNWRTRHWPFDEKKSIRFWGHSNGIKVGNLCFSWNSPRARLSRERLKRWALWNGCRSETELRGKMGPRWGWHFIRDLEEAEESRSAILAAAEEQRRPRLFDLTKLEFLLWLFPEDLELRAAAEPYIPAPHTSPAACP